MAEIRFDLSGFTEYQQALVRMLALLTDLRPFWPRLVPAFVGWMRERFSTEGEFGGDPWAPLSPAYLTRKMQLYPGKGIMYATGQLRRRASNPVRRVTPTTLLFEIPEFTRVDGRQMDPAWFDVDKDTTPARPVIPPSWNVALPEVIQVEVDDIAQEWIDEMANKLGLNH